MKDIDHLHKIDRVPCPNQSKKFTPFTSYLVTFFSSSLSASILSPRRSFVLHCVRGLFRFLYSQELFSLCFLAFALYLASMIVPFLFLTLHTGCSSFPYPISHFFTWSLLVLSGLGVIILDFGILLIFSWDVTWSCLAIFLQVKKSVKRGKVIGRQEERKWIRLISPHNGYHQSQPYSSRNPEPFLAELRTSKSNFGKTYF